MIGSFKEWRSCIKSDAYRYMGFCGGGNSCFDASLFYTIPGFRYVFWLRACNYLGGKPLLYPMYLYSRWRLRTCSYKFGIQIPMATRIAPGFCIGHFGSIVVNPNAVLGKNISILQGVTIGQLQRGARKGTPVIGDNVYIGPDAKVLGAVKIGSNVVIGANAVVAKDVPDNAVVAGVPAQIISMKGSDGYIRNPI